MQLKGLSISTFQFLKFVIFFFFCEKFVIYMYIYIFFFHFSIPLSAVSRILNTHGNFNTFKVFRVNDIQNFTKNKYCKMTE